MFQLTLGVESSCSGTRLGPCLDCSCNTPAFVNLDENQGKRLIEICVKRGLCVTVKLDENQSMYLGKRGKSPKSLLRDVNL